MFFFSNFDILKFKAFERKLVFESLVTEAITKFHFMIIISNILQNLVSLSFSILYYLFYCDVHVHILGIFIAYIRVQSITDEPLSAQKNDILLLIFLSTKLKLLFFVVYTILYML